jgi:signal transduction histidine kinase
MLSARQMFEVSALFVAMLMVAQLVFGATSAPVWSVFDFPYFVFLFLLWAALRFDPPIVATASLAMTVLLIWNADQGRGPFIVQGVLCNTSWRCKHSSRDPLSALILSQWSRARRAERLLASITNSWSSSGEAHPGTLPNPRPGLTARKPRTRVPLPGRRPRQVNFANMSHELRTPLNAGYSEMLQEEAEDLGQEEFILSPEDQCRGQAFADIAQRYSRLPNRSG